MNEATELPTTEKRRSKLNFLSMLVLCLASICLSATVVMIFQLKQGIPFSLAISIALALAVAMLLPFVIMMLQRKLVGPSRYGNTLSFLISNVLISVGLGLSIF